MKKGEIWLVEFPTSNGHEQTGTRPVIVIAEMPPIAVIVPFTKEVEPTKTNGLDIVSVALVFQIRAIDIRRLKRKVGDIEAPIMKNMDAMLKKLLELG